MMTGVYCSSQVRRTYVSLCEPAPSNPKRRCAPSQAVAYRHSEGHQRLTAACRATRAEGDLRRLGVNPEPGAIAIAGCPIDHAGWYAVNSGDTLGAPVSFGPRAHLSCVSRGVAS